MPQQFADKEIAGDILCSIKASCTGYMHGVLEAQDPSIRRTFMDFQNQCLHDSEKIFRYMQDKGWYKVPMVHESSIV